MLARKACLHGGNGGGGAAAAVACVGAAGGGLPVWVMVAHGGVRSRADDKDTRL